MNIKLSIIVPAYNPGKKIERCVNSLLNQSFTDYEIIVVNDGSTDGTAEILEQLHKSLPEGKKSLLRIITQPNMGVSSARNNGINIAQGDYIMFVDADDTIEPDCIPQIFNYLDKSSFTPDFVIFGMKCITIGGETTNIATFDYEEIHNVKKFYKDLSCNVLAIGAPWGRFYRREIINNHHLTFNTAFKRHQDVIFNMDFARYCNSVSTIPVYGYNYIRSKQGATMKFFGEEIIFLNNGVRDSLIGYFVGYCHDEEVMLRINRRSAFDYLYSIYTIYRQRGVSNKFFWLKRYWNAAEKNNPQFSFEYNSGIPKFVGKIGRKSKFLCHLFLYTIFSAEKLKLKLRR